MNAKKEIKASSERKITIDGESYNLGSLSELAKQQLSSIRIADIEISRAEALLGMLKTARAVYANELKKELAKK